MIVPDSRLDLVSASFPGGSLFWLRRGTLDDAMACVRARRGGAGVTPLDVMGEFAIQLYDAEARNGMST